MMTPDPGLRKTPKGGCPRVEISPWRKTPKGGVPGFGIL
jgi:hypothetical protein